MHLPGGMDASPGGGLALSAHPPSYTVDLSSPHGVRGGIRPVSPKGGQFSPQWRGWCALDGSPLRWGKRAKEGNGQRGIYESPGVMVPSLLIYSPRLECGGGGPCPIGLSSRMERGGVLSELPHVWVFGVALPYAIGGVRALSVPLISPHVMRGYTLSVSSSSVSPMECGGFLARRCPPQAPRMECGGVQPYRYAPRTPACYAGGLA